jgi:hypothetical protein
MSLYRVDQAVVRGGTVSVTNLPLPDGERVQIIVSDPPAQGKRGIADVRQLLRGGVERYDNPFQPCTSAES